MASPVQKTSWLEITDAYPRLKNMTDDEKLEIGRWVYWELSNTNPPKARQLLQQLFVDEGFMADHAGFRSSDNR